MDLGDIMDDGQNTITPQINYELLVEDALRAVVRSSLRIAEDNGLPGNTHFYMTFLTDADGVEVPERLKESHPERMTIVIQHQYWELKVKSEKFSVTLAFGGVPEKLAIPFSAVVDFNDPSVGFGLQFAHEETESEIQSSDIPDPDESPSADIVSLDTFRKQP